MVVAEVQVFYLLGTAIGRIQVRYPKDIYTYLYLSQVGPWMFHISPQLGLYINVAISTRELCYTSMLGCSRKCPHAHLENPGLILLSFEIFKKRSTTPKNSTKSVEILLLLQIHKQQEDP